MGSFLGGGAKGGSKPIAAASQLRIQSSVNGQPIPFIHGQQRLSLNLLWYDNFEATPQQSSSSGGKSVGGGGGGKGTAGTAGYTYSVDFIGGICEGPIDAVLGAWNNKTAWGIGALGLTPYDGAQGQAPSPLMLATYPTAPLGYSSIAYVQAEPIQLGTSPELPNITLEVRGAVSGAVTETFAVASPYTYQATGFSLACSVTEQVAVPPVAPYQVQAQTPYAPNTVLVQTDQVPSTSIPGSTSAGAVYTSTGTPLTRVSANPTAGQFVMSGGLYTFAAADANALITLVDFAIGPGVNYAYQPTGDLVAGSQTVTGLSSLAGVAAGQLVTGAGVAPGSVVNGVSGGVSPTGSTTSGSRTVGSLSSVAGLAVGSPIGDSGGAVPADTTIAGITPGTVTLSAEATAFVAGDVIALAPPVLSGTWTGTTITGLASTAGIVAGLAVTDPTGDQIMAPMGVVVAAVGATSVMVNIDSGGSVPDIFTFGAPVSLTCELTAGSAVIAMVGGASTAGLLPGSAVADPYGLLAGAYVVSVLSGSVIVSQPVSAAALGATSLDMSVTFSPCAMVATTGAGSATLTGASGGFYSGAAVVSDSANVIPTGATVTAVTPGSLTLSAEATATVAGDTFTIPPSVILSQPATASESGATLTFYGAALAQRVLPLGASGGPEALGPGQFALDVSTPSTFGTYTFSAQDDGNTVVIIDVPDADPSLSLIDFLSNPRYGCGFPAGNIGDLTALQAYAYATGMFISPAIVSAQAANQYLDDFSKGLNGEFVWSAGLLSFVPYGDQVITGNGHTYTPQPDPYYSLGDDDYLPNEGTSSIGVSAFTSDDPVVCVRKRPSDALNDVKVQYLDRGNAYNPAIVEAQDDAAINLFGLKPATTRQLDFFCIEAAAVTSANLQLARQSVRNQYSFTAPWCFILLDPMDIIEISDDALGLDNQLVRILEILENQEDWSLTFSVEEVLDGTGTTPIYGTQPKADHAPNYNISPPSAAAPVIFEPPPALASNGALETWLLTGGSTTAWGGCNVWISSDGSTYRQAGQIIGGSRAGAVTADFAAGSDPDTTDTLAVALATSGQLLGGTQQDADLAHTLCYVGGYAVPVAPTLGAVAGGSLAAADYYVRVAYVFPGGEGPPSAEEMLPLAADTLLTAASPAAQSAATGWNVYVGTSAGAETRQNGSPIAIGTGWAQPSSGLTSGGAAPDSETEYELVSYEGAALTGAGTYDLGTYIRRGQYGSTISDHPAGSLFARLDGTQLAIPYDKSQIGQTIFVKLTSFNAWGGGEEDLSAVQAYQHLIAGPPVPPAVSGFSAQQTGGAVTFAWVDDADAGMSLKGYDLSYAPKGAGIASAILLTEASRATEMTNASVPPGAWTFYIRGHDLADQLGPAATADLTVTGQYPLVEAEQNAPGWLGLYEQPGVLGSFVIGTSILD